MKDQEFSMNEKAVLTQYIAEREYLSDETSIGSFKKDDRELITSGLIGGLVWNFSLVALIFFIDLALFHVIDWSHKVAGPFTIGWVIFLFCNCITTYFVMRNLLVEKYNNLATTYFGEGVRAAYRQCYLANTNLTAKDFEVSLERMLKENSY